MSGLRRD